MAERFIPLFDNIFRDGRLDGIKDNGKIISLGDGIDLLNELHKENEELKEENQNWQFIRQQWNKEKQSIPDLLSEMYELKRDIKELEKENKALKVKLHKIQLISKGF